MAKINLANFSPIVEPENRHKDAMLTLTRNSVRFNKVASQLLTDQKQFAKKNNYYFAFQQNQKDKQILIYLSDKPTDWPARNNFGTSLSINRTNLAQSLYELFDLKPKNFTTGVLLSHKAKLTSVEIKVKNHQAGKVMLLDENSFIKD